MKKKMLFLIIGILVLVLIILTIIPIRWVYPGYERLGSSKEMGNMFKLDGIIYRNLPATLWLPIPGIPYKYIGSADKLDFYSFEDSDTKKIFIEIRFQKEHWYDDVVSAPAYSYRADVTLPSFDRKGIDEIEYTVNKGSSFEGIKPVIRNADLVNSLFDVLETASNSGEYTGKDNYYLCSIFCMNSSFQAIGIELTVYAYGQDYWVLIDTPERPRLHPTIYAKIPRDLLEQIAGQKLPTPSEYIASKQKTAS